MKKRALAIVMAGLMAVSMSSVCAYAKDEEKEAKTEGFYIGLSNGYWGNTWRAQMVEDFENKAEEYKEEGIISDYMISNSNSDATEQLNQINAMIDSGVDAILIDAVSPTTIKSAVEKAKAKGILVVMQMTRQLMKIRSVSVEIIIHGRRSRQCG